MNYIKKKSKIQYEVNVYSDEEALLTYLSSLSEQEVDILILSDYGILEHLNVAVNKLLKSIIFLYDDYEDNKVIQSNDLNGQIPQIINIFKYQSAKKILEEINKEQDAYMTVKERSDYCGSKCKIIGIYSPASKSYKTTFALAVSAILSKNERVMYVNLEEYSGLSETLLISTACSLSEILYMYRRGSLNITDKIKESVGKLGNVDYISPSRYADDLADFLADDWAMFLEFLRSRLDYDYIVVDMGNIIRKVWCVLRIMDIVYMPVNSDRVGQQKVNDFYQDLSSMGHEDVLNKITKVEVPTDGRLAEGDISIDTITWGVMGNYARGILNER